MCVNRTSDACERAGPSVCLMPQAQHVMTELEPVQVDVTPVGVRRVSPGIPSSGGVEVRNSNPDSVR